jgi:hypothetical protein
MLSSTASQSDVDIEALIGDTKQCECRPFMVVCPHPAVWLYRQRCCGGTTFVCRLCRRMHREQPNLKWQCRWCKTPGTVEQLVKTVIAI